MNDCVLEINPQPETGALQSRGELAGIMRRACDDISATHYILLEQTASRGPRSVRILTSNWLFDWIEDFGTDGIGRILESGFAAVAGGQPRQVVTANCSFLTPGQRRSLRETGHAELYCQKLLVAGGHVYAVFTAPKVDAIEGTALARAHMSMTYALDRFLAATRTRRTDDRLSERERECLLWVSEGKTTEEVAVILGVSANTVNSYVSHAIQKFGAANRAMAIATAIRSGII